jgi:hypothetical protein
MRRRLQPAIRVLSTAHSQLFFVKTALDYLGLTLTPETPALPSSRDRLQAHQLQQRRLPPSDADRDGFLVGFSASTPETTRRPSLVPDPFPSLLRASHRGTSSQSCRHLHRIPSAQNATLRREKDHRRNPIRRVFNKMYIQMIADT